jgi:hypothetical protein
MTATKVSITKEGSAEDLVNEALNLLDLRSRLPSNAKVFVKPNLVRVPREANISYEDGAWEKTFVPEGDIVHREVIAALLGALVDMGVKDVTVGPLWDPSERFRYLDQWYIKTKKVLSTEKTKLR